MSNKPDIIKAIIKERKTLKVLGDAQNLALITPESASQNRALVLDSLQIAGWAPFHYARGEDSLAEPWRAHVLWHKECQKLAPKLFQWFPSMKPSSKIPRMMYACGALVLVTWIPQFYHIVEDKKDSQLATDEEHLAASSAMVQNLLLLLTAHGMGTYWSSGGKLRSELFFERVGIPAKERLLAAVFVEYPETLDNRQDRLPGKHRDSRSDGWIKELNLGK